jgi:hypothetical protein
MIQFSPIGPTSLGLLLDAVGVVTLSYVLFRTTLKQQRSIEETIADTRRLLFPPDLSEPSNKDNGGRLHASIAALGKKARYAFLHLSIIVSGALFLICGLASQLYGAWPN